MEQNSRKEVALAEEGFNHIIFDPLNITDLEPFDISATQIIPEDVLILIFFSQSS